MAERIRTEAQRKADLASIAAWVREGKTQEWMAGQLEVSRQQVAYDIAELKQIWGEEAKAILASTVTEAAQKLREIIVGQYGANQIGLARTRLAAVKELFDRVGPPSISKQVITEDDIDAAIDAELERLHAGGQGAVSGPASGEGK